MNGEISNQTPSDAVCLKSVEQSPAAVAAHDRDGWLSLFTRQYTVEDPVGSAPVRPLDAREPQEALARFYDTFIAPNTIRFEVYQNYFGTYRVARDLTVYINLSPDVCVAVPMHLLYELEDGSGKLKISRLAAHWELAPMMGQMFTRGIKAIPVMWQFSRRLYKASGLIGIFDFLRAIFTPRKRHFALLDRLIVGINCENSVVIARNFVQGAQLCYGDDAAVLPSDLRGIVVEKRIAAGEWVSATVRFAAGTGLLMGKICPSEKKFTQCVLYRTHS